MSFLVSSVKGWITVIAIFFAIGAVVLLVNEISGGGPLKTESQRRAEQVDQATAGVEEAAAAAEKGLAIYAAENQLIVDGDYDRYRIVRTEMDDGDLSVFTRLPPGKASEAKVARLCEKLIGGDPPLFEVKDWVFVFGKGITPIRADECDIQFWQGDARR